MARRYIGTAQGLHTVAGVPFEVFAAACATDADLGQPFRESMVFQGWHTLAVGSSSSGGSAPARTAVWGRTDCNDALFSASGSLSSGSHHGADIQRGLGVYQGLHTINGVAYEVRGIACCVGTPQEAGPTCADCVPTGKQPRYLNWEFFPNAPADPTCTPGYPYKFFTPLGLMVHVEGNPGDTASCLGSSSSSSGGNPGTVQCVWKNGGDLGKQVEIIKAPYLTAVFQIRGNPPQTPFISELVLRVTANEHGPAFCLRYRGPNLTCDPLTGLMHGVGQPVGVLLLTLAENTGCVAAAPYVRITPFFGSYDTGPHFCCAKSSSSSGSGSLGSGSGSPPPPPPPPPSGSSSGQSSLSGSKSSGSGASFSTTDGCAACPDGAPVVYAVEVSGIVSGGDPACDADCTGLNGTYYLVNIPGLCVWEFRQSVGVFCGDIVPTDLLIVLTLGTFPPGPGQDVTFTYSNDGQTYKSVGDWNCLGENICNFLSSTVNPKCTFPATIRVYPA